MTNAAIRYVLVKVPVTTANEVVTVTQRVPAQMKKCLGVLHSIPTTAQTVLAVLTAGTVSVCLQNDSSSNISWPIKFAWGNANIGNFNKAFKEMDEEIIFNCLATIKYSDNGAMVDNKGNFIPYQVNVYLKCLK